MALPPKLPQEGRRARTSSEQWPIANCAPDDGGAANTEKMKASEASTTKDPRTEDQEHGQPGGRNRRIDRSGSTQSPYGELLGLSPQRDCAIARSGKETHRPTRYKTGHGEQGEERHGKYAATTHNETNGPFAARGPNTAPGGDTEGNPMTTMHLRKGKV